MFAAPTASKDFQLLALYETKTWKEKITFLQHLINQIQVLSDLKKIQICFPQLLSQKNVNVLLKVGKLIQLYIQTYQIQYISYRQLAQAISSCCSITLFPSSEIIGKLYQVAQTDKKQLIIKGVQDTLTTPDKNISGIIKIWQQLALNNKTKLSFCSSKKLEQNLVQYIKIVGDDGTENLLDFLKYLSEVIGTYATVLARKICFPKISQLNEYILNKKYEQRTENLNVNYVYNIGDTQWNQDFQCIPVKVVALSLRSTIDSQQSLTLSKNLLESLSWLANKKISNVNSYIYTLIVKNIHRNRAYVVYTQELFELIFSIANTKKIYKRFTDIVNNKQDMQIQQEMWFGTINLQRMLDKIQKSKDQEQYHRLVNIIDLMNVFDHSLQIQCIKQMLKKPNLNKVYKIKLQNLLKAENNKQK